MDGMKGRERFSRHRSPLRHVGGCQNYGSFLGTLNNRCRITIGTPKGTIILTTTHVDPDKTAAV